MWLDSLPIAAAAECQSARMSNITNYSYSTRPVWAWERCRISPRLFVSECHKRKLGQASFVLLYFALFAFSGLCLVRVFSVFLICLLTCIFQHEPTDWHSIA